MKANINRPVHLLTILTYLILNVAIFNPIKVMAEEKPRKAPSSKSSAYFQLLNRFCENVWQQASLGEKNCSQYLKTYMEKNPVKESAVMKDFEVYGLKALASICILENTSFTKSICLQSIASYIDLGENPNSKDRVPLNTENFLLKEERAVTTFANCIFDSDGGYVVPDEAYRCMAEQYQKIFEVQVPGLLLPEASLSQNHPVIYKIGDLAMNGSKCLLTLAATPFEMIGMGSGQSFAFLVDAIRSMVKRKWTGHYSYCASQINTIVLKNLVYAGCIVPASELVWSDLETYEIPNECR
jgi:hypothetical protein